MDVQKISISFVGEDKASSEHKAVIRDLVRYLKDRYGSEINYDHVFTTFKRSPIPLTFRGKRYDISFILGDRLVLIQVDTKLYKPQKQSEGS